VAGGRREGGDRKEDSSRLKEGDQRDLNVFAHKSNFVSAYG
jgi:hypothetical protein